MFKKRGKAATIALLIALIMILIFGFRASAQKSNHGPVSRVPEHKTPAAPSHHGSSAPPQFSVHPAARFSTGPYEEIPDDFTEAVLNAPFPGFAQEELAQMDLSRSVRITDNGYETAEGDLSSGASPSGNRANSPLLFYYNPPTPSSPANPTVTSTPPASPIGPPTYVPTENPYYVSSANPYYVSTGTASAAPVPSSLLLLASGLIVFYVLKKTVPGSAYSVQRQKPVQR